MPRQIYESLDVLLLCPTFLLECKWHPIPRCPLLLYHQCLDTFLPGHIEELKVTCHDNLKEHLGHEPSELGINVYVADVLKYEGIKWIIKYSWSLVLSLFLHYRLIMRIWSKLRFWSSRNIMLSSPWSASNNFRFNLWWKDRCYYMGYKSGISNKSNAWKCCYVPAEIKFSKFSIETRKSKVRYYHKMQTLWI